MENPGRAEARQAFSIFIPLPYIKSAPDELPYPKYIFNIQTGELLDIGTEDIRPDAHARAAFATASLNELSRCVSRGGQPYTPRRERLSDTAAIVEGCQPNSLLLSQSSFKDYGKQRP